MPLRCKQCDPSSDSFQVLFHPVREFSERSSRIIDVYRMNLNCERHGVSGLVGTHESEAVTIPWMNHSPHNASHGSCKPCPSSGAFYTHHGGPPKTQPCQQRTDASRYAGHSDIMSKSRRVNMNANALSFSYYYGHHSDVR